VPSSKIKLIVFDAYGVTLNGGYPDTMKALAEKFHRDCNELYEVFYRYFNMATENKISETDGWKLPIEELKLTITWQEVYDLHFSLIKVNKLMIDFTQKLRKRYKVVLLSKNTKMQFEEALKRFELRRHFDEVLNTQDWNTTKTEPRAYELLIKKFNVEPFETVYIDDQEVNLVAAREVGLKTILYKDFEQFKEEIEEII